MALTKVRSPVADIDTISNGTTNIDIASSGADAIVTVAGTTVATFAATGLTFEAGLTLTVDNIVGEEIDLSTTAGATASITTTAAQLEIETTSAHPVVLGANSIDALTIETDGQVTLGVVGDASGQLVDKNYVDTLIATVPLLADTVTSLTDPGSLVIPNSTGTDFVINWGVTASISNTQTAVTFDTAFPNACFLGIACRQNAGASLESAAHVKDITTSGMNVVNSGGTSSPVGWIAIGY